jgi:hypothetical protein
MLTRRRLLEALGAAAGGGGLLFGTNAAPVATDSGPDTAGLRVDTDAGVDVAGVRTGANGALAVDLDDLPAHARVAYGRFEDLSAPSTIQEGVFAVGPGSDAERPLDISLGVEADPTTETETELYLAAVAPGEPAAVTSTASAAPATVRAVPPGGAVSVGLVVDTGAVGRLEPTFTLEAE